MMRYEWTPASEPPDSDRWVLAWHKQSPMCDEGMRLNCCIENQWVIGRLSITHWRDVEPPDVPETHFGDMAGGE